MNESQQIDTLDYLRKRLKELSEVIILAQGIINSDYPKARQETKDAFNKLCAQNGFVEFDIEQK